MVGSAKDNNPRSCWVFVHQLAVGHDSTSSGLNLLTGTVADAVGGDGVTVGQLTGAEQLAWNEDGGPRGRSGLHD